MKRFIALLLVVVIAATMLSITAFAESGYYNGQYYVANVTLSGTYIYGAFTVSGGSFVSCQIAGYVQNKNYGSGEWYWSTRPMRYSDYGSTFDSYTFNSGSLNVSEARMWYAYKALSGYVYDN